MPPLCSFVPDVMTACADLTPFCLFSNLLTEKKNKEKKKKEEEKRWPNIQSRIRSYERAIIDADEDDYDSHEDAGHVKSPPESPKLSFRDSVSELLASSGEHLSRRGKTRSLA